MTGSLSLMLLEEIIPRLPRDLDLLVRSENDVQELLFMGAKLEQTDWGWSVHYRGRLREIDICVFIEPEAKIYPKTVLGLIIADPAETWIAKLMLNSGGNEATYDDQPLKRVLDPLSKEALRRLRKLEEEQR